jgi:hypothetical protein
VHRNINSINRFLEPFTASHHLSPPFNNILEFRMSAAAGSSPPPPPGGKGPSKDTDHAAPSLKANIPLSGDGKTAQTAMWSSDMFRVLGPKKTYIVDGVGLSPRYRRVTVDEVRDFIRHAYTVLDGETHEVITAAQIPSSPLGNPSMPTATAVPAQLLTVEAQENLIATGSGAVTEAYNAAQVHRK